MISTGNLKQSIIKPQLIICRRILTCITGLFLAIIGIVHEKLLTLKETMNK